MATKKKKRCKTVAYQWLFVVNERENDNNKKKKPKEKGRKSAPPQKAIGADESELKTR